MAAESTLHARMRRPLLIATVAAALLAGCGKDDDGGLGQPVTGVRGSEEQSEQGLGFPTFATKNTTRIPGADPIAGAAAVARAVYPAATGGTRPDAVTIAGQGDWRTGLAASVLVAPPLRAPVLFSDGDDLPPASDGALNALGPRGARALGGAQVIRIGDVARPSGFKTRDVEGDDPFELASEIDRLSATVRGGPSDRVMVVGADDPAFAMPAAGWAAKSGDPILFVRRDSVPPATRTALRRHERPRIYVVGPPSAVGAKALRELRKLGRVRRIHGPDPVRNAIAFARYLDGVFGWGVVDSGHGLVFANASQPLAAAAAAPLSSSGKYGPLLLLDQAGALPRPLGGYLLDIQPGYARDPVRGVYNHGWVIGDDRAVSTAVQARIDALLEILPVDRRRRTGNS
jgi:hypothetical protein